MWKFWRRQKNEATFDLGDALILEPSRKNAQLLRRWTYLANTGKSARHQFNVYLDGSGVLLTMQDLEHGETQELAHVHGGHMPSIAVAWDTVARFISDIILGSQLIEGKFNTALVVETTPFGESPVSPLALLRMTAEGVEEIRHEGADQRLK